MSTKDEFGSYYGSVILAVDVNNDGIDEIFVAAPVGAGNTFDEGYVYYYKGVSNSSNYITFVWKLCSIII